MKTLLALSPHLDDAVFSAGATIAQASRRGWRTIIATIFTGNVAQPRGFALACQLDKGLPPDVDYMALRRAEYAAACALLDAEALHLPFLEAPHRGYDDVPALFAHVRSDDEAKTDVAHRLSVLIEEVRPTRILAPLGLGGHVDHLIVRDALLAAERDPPVHLWEDWPYAEPLEHPNRADARIVPADRDALAAKSRACEAYASQLDFQFGGADRLRTMLSRQAGEWFHPARSNAAVARP